LAEGSRSRGAALVVGAVNRLLYELSEVKFYEVEYESKTYQVEVEILENTARYVYVMVGVDDGSLPASISPETHSLICRKPGPPW
jgi:hypothetical protein